MQDLQKPGKRGNPPGQVIPQKTRLRLPADNRMLAGVAVAGRSCGSQSLEADHHRHELQFEREMIVALPMPIGELQPECLIVACNFSQFLGTLKRKLRVNVLRLVGRTVARHQQTKREFVLGVEFVSRPRQPLEDTGRFLG